MQRGRRCTPGDTMSPSTFCRTLLVAMSLCCCCCLCLSSEFRGAADKPKELLRHQQNRRPPFIDRRLTLASSRIQRYAADESDPDYSSSSSATMSSSTLYIGNNKSQQPVDDDAAAAAIVVAAEPDDQALEDKDANNYDDDDDDEAPESSLEKPMTQIRHGRSRGRFARPITKLDDKDDLSVADSALEAAKPVDATRVMADEATLTGDVRYNNNNNDNNDTYPDFDFEVSGAIGENHNFTGISGSNSSSSGGGAANQSARTRSAIGGGVGAAANQSARTRSPSNGRAGGGSETDSRRFSELSRGQTWLDASASSASASGRVVKSEVVDARDVEASGGRRVDSFEKLRKVVAGSRGHGKGYKNNNGGGGGSVGEILDAENSTRRRTDIDGTRNTGAAADTAVGGYGVVVHGIRDAPEEDEATRRRDFTGYYPSDDDRRNSSAVRAGDYEEDYWDIGDAAAAAADADELGGNSGRGSSSSSTRRPDKQQSVQVDIVTRFLRIIENQHLLGENCTAGTDLNLGEGVVDQYAQERFRLEANLAVNRANMLTRLWKYAPDVMLSSEYLLHASILSMVEFDEDIFAAGNCYDKLQYRERWLYCPFAHRLQDQDGVLVKDLAVEYKYLSNSSEWFYIARKNAERVIASNNQFSRGYHTYTHNESTHTNRVEDEILTVKYEDGRWSKPYYDCGGGNIWMLTYTVPFFGYTNDTYFFKGTSGIDIDLRRVDIDQCPLPTGSTQLNIFAASDKCKSRTTECIAIPGLGFRRGSYRCVCKRGYYYPDTKSTERYYNGTVIEEEYEKLMLGEDSQYSEDGVFECLPCAEGCEYCEDGSPCVVSLNWLMRTAILILECCIIACLPVVILFTWKFGDVKVVRAASPVLLRVIVLGAFFIYCTTIVMYPRPNVVTCTIRVWLREIGFSLTYGALMLKTWRISVIFRVKSAKAVKITDMNLLKRLGIIVTIFAVFLGIRTLVAPPVVIVARTADDLKAYLCRTDWWDHSFTTLEVMFLVWGIRLCIVVRKAPSEFNESRFISMAIYNEFLLSVFLNVSMLFLQSPANPDLLYIIFFCHTQLTVTLLLCLIFGSKAYVVFRGGGKEDAVGKLQGATGKFIGKTCRTQGTSNQTNSISLQQGNFTEEADGVTEEFRRLYAQLELLKEKNMRLGNRHLVTKIQAMQEASSRAETQVSTIQTISSSLRLSVEQQQQQQQQQQPCSSSSTIEETEVSSRLDSKPAASVYHHQQRPQDAADYSTRNHGAKKKALESKNETNVKTRRTNQPQEEGLTDDAEPKCTCSKDENPEAPAAGDNDDEDLFAKSCKDDNVNHETVAENGDAVVAVGASQVSRSLSSSDNVEVAAAAAGPGLVASSTRIKEVAAAAAVASAASAGNNSGSNNGAGAKERGKNKSGHARTHAIVINLDDKSRFSEEVTV